MDVQQRDHQAGLLAIAANAAIVVGEGDARYRADPLATDLPWCGAVLRLNGAVEETGLAAGVQGHPAIGIAWLAEKLAPWGEQLQAGQTVLAGSFTRPVAARAGDLFEADISAATVVMMYLSPTVNARLEAKLRKDLRPGTRIVSHQFPIGTWPAEKTVRAEDGTLLYLWTVPPASK